MSGAKSTAHCTRLPLDTVNGHAGPYDDGRLIVMLDIDNTLYSKATRIPEMMQDLIQQFFVRLGLSEAEADELHSHYFREYGLSLRGLIRHRGVDPLVYNRECDGRLPLEDILKPDARVRALIERIDRRKARVWGLTNAYRDHALRVLRLLGLVDLFEGVISCDYAHPEFRCKPEPEYLADALAHVGVADAARYRFVDDSSLNVAGALAAGWTHSLVFDEDGTEAPKAKVRGVAAANVITSLDELPARWPEVFA